MSPNIPNNPNLNIYAGTYSKHPHHPQQEQGKLNTTHIRPTHRQVQPPSHRNRRLFTTILDPLECGHHLVPIRYRVQVCRSPPVQQHIPQNQTTHQHLQLQGCGGSHHLRGMLKYSVMLV